MSSVMSSTFWVRGDQDHTIHSWQESYGFFFKCRIYWGHDQGSFSGASMSSLASLRAWSSFCSIRWLRLGSVSLVSVGVALAWWHLQFVVVSTKWNGLTFRIAGVLREYWSVFYFRSWPLWSPLLPYFRSFHCLYPLLCRLMIYVLVSNFPFFFGGGGRHFRLRLHDLQVP